MENRTQSAAQKTNRRKQTSPHPPTQTNLRSMGNTVKDGSKYEAWTEDVLINEDTPESEITRYKVSDTSIKYHLKGK